MCLPVMQPSTMYVQRTPSSYSCHPRAIQPSNAAAACTRLHATCAHAGNTRRRADVSQDVLPPCYQCPTPVQTVLVGAGGRHICLSTSVGTGWPRHVLKPRARSTALGRSAPAAACSALRAVRWILHVDDGRHSHASHSDARLPQSHNGARLVRWSSVATYCPDPTTLEALLTTILRVYVVQ
jgi:hypothetical protein